MSEVIRKGIEEANKELEKENTEKLMHEVSFKFWLFQIFHYAKANHISAYNSVSLNDVSG